MRNIQLLIEYDGTRYDGWQKQKESASHVSIQEKIEEVLSKMEHERIEVIGAARTEKGVHAYGQSASFKTNSHMKLYEIKHYLNRFLPMDIAVTELREVPERFHAAFSAKAYIYQYRIAIGEVPSVFDRKYQYYSFKPLDAEKMRQAAEGLMGTHDYRAFSDNKRLKKSTQRTIEYISVEEEEKEIRITVKGDDFWPHMVRIMAGTIVDAGLLKIAPEEIPAIIESRDREMAGDILEAKGLFLKEVVYH